MSAFYNFGKGELMKGNIDLDTGGDTIKVAFMDPAHSLDIDGDHYYSDISGDIASGSTDQTLANQSVTVDDANERAVFDADDISVASETITGGTDTMIIYKDTGTPATSPLIASIDIDEGTLTPIDGTLVIVWNSDGIFAF